MNKLNISRSNKSKEVLFHQWSLKYCIGKNAEWENDKKEPETGKRRETYIGNGRKLDPKQSHKT